jgi:hypothetical protein
MQQPRPRPIRQRFLGDQLFGQVKLEIRDQHSTDYKEGLLRPAFLFGKDSNNALSKSFFHKFWIVSTPELLVLCLCQSAARFVVDSP